MNNTTFVNTPTQNASKAEEASERFSSHAKLILRSLKTMPLELAHLNAYFVYLNLAKSILVKVHGVPFIEKVHHGVTTKDAMQMGGSFHDETLYIKKKGVLPSILLECFQLQLKGFEADRLHVRVHEFSSPKPSYNLLGTVLGEPPNSEANAFCAEVLRLYYASNLMRYNPHVLASIITEHKDTFVHRAPSLKHVLRVLTGEAFESPQL